MSMYYWEFLSFITSSARVPDRLHPETIACTKFEVAKVFIQADFSKELPKARIRSPFKEKKPRLNLLVHGFYLSAPLVGNGTIMRTVVLGIRLK